MSGTIVSELGTIMDLTENIAPDQAVLIGETQAFAAGTTGALGTHNLVKIGTTTPLVLPEGFTVTHILIRIADLITVTGGTPTISIGRLNASSVYEAAFSAATAYDKLNGAVLDATAVTPLFGTVVAPVPITAEGGSIAKYNVLV